MYGGRYLNHYMNSFDYDAARFTHEYSGVERMAEDIKTYASSNTRYEREVHNGMIVTQIFGDLVRTASLRTL